MNFKRFFIYTIVELAALTLLKVLFFKNGVFTGQAVGEIIFWGLSLIVTLALVRRFGVINFLEVIFTFTVWLAVSVFVDLVLTSSYTGLHMFATAVYWFNYLIIAVAVMVFHKKRHVQVRHELHAKAHAQAHGGEHKH